MEEYSEHFEQDLKKYSLKETRPTFTQKNTEIPIGEYKSQLGINIHSRNIINPLYSGYMKLGNKNRIYIEDGKIIGYYCVDASRSKGYLLTRPEDILTFLKSEYYKDSNEFHSERFHTKGLSVVLYYRFNIPKSKSIKWIQELNQKGLIKRVSERGNCKTVCASCEEEGCDVTKPPINFWQVVEK